MVTFACFENKFRCSYELSVVYPEGEIGSQAQENYNNLINKDTNKSLGCLIQFYMLCL